VLLRERFHRLHPLEMLEVALVRACLDHPGAISIRQEAQLRWALSLARLVVLPEGGAEVPLEHEVLPLRELCLRRLEPALSGAVPDLAALAAAAVPLVGQARQTRDGLLRRHADRVNPTVLDRELREKKLALALGGGGGTAYAHLGAFSLLDEWKLVPSLISASSMGAVMGLFRARSTGWDASQVLTVLRSLSFQKLFRILAVESRYGLPAALRLHLRGPLARWFQLEDGAPLRLRDLAIPLVISISGIRRGMLPRPLSYYEGLLEPRTLALRPWLLRTKLAEVTRAIAEMLARPQILDRIHVGYEPWTEDFDAVDTVGFSTAVPGMIHYDVLGEGDPMHPLLGRLLEDRGVFRLIDGGITDNVPARAAWRLVQRGRLGTRNALVLALDGFAPRIATPTWLPLQQIAAENVRSSVRYAHVVRTYRRTPSPLDIVPGVDLVLRAIERGRAELARDMPAVSRLLEPLPPLEEVASLA
jgi:predicted acylesterase/phospholipase RssA